MTNILYKKTFVLTTKVIAIGILLAGFMACQSNSYKIKGTAAGMKDGETLILADLHNTTHDTIVVDEGEFELKGTVDTVQLYTLYTANGSQSALFFLEPGTIKIEFKENQPLAVVSGTEANEAWQQLQEMTEDYGDRLQKLTEILYDEEMSAEEHHAAMSKIDFIRKELNSKILEMAEQNIDNEFGFFVIANTPCDESFTKERRNELIEMMPEAFKSRSALR